MDTGRRTSQCVIKNATMSIKIRAHAQMQANGALRDMVCRSMMLMLHRAGLIELPPVRQVWRNTVARRDAPALVNVDEAALRMSLSELGPLEVRQVRRTPEEALFNSLMQHHHYLGYTQPVGEHLKYLVYAQGRPVACVAWSSSPRHLGSRDRFIGWDQHARRCNIALLAYNTRFLILPWVTVAHLASHILGRMARVLSADWQRLPLTSWPTSASMTCSGTSASANRLRTV